MESTQQLLSPIAHSWTDPAHYLQCSICREFRRLESLKQSRLAKNTARMVAITVGQNPRTRVLSVSPRLRDPRLRRVSQQEGPYPVTPVKRVTIQLPNLARPVHTDSPIGLSIKRPRTFVDNPEPAQYFVPEPLDPVSPLPLSSHRATMATLPAVGTIAPACRPYDTNSMFLSAVDQ